MYIYTHSACFFKQDFEISLLKADTYICTYIYTHLDAPNFETLIRNLLNCTSNLLLMSEQVKFILP